MLCLLGRPTVLVGTGADAPGVRPKAIAVLAYLALHEGTPAPRRELARLVFPDAEAPLAALRWHLHHLRSTGPGSSRRTSSRGATASASPCRPMSRCFATGLSAPHGA